MIALTLYRAATALAAPLAPWLLARRARRGKEDEHRRGERLGHPVVARPSGRLVWMHGASVGESLALLPIVDALLTRQSGLSVLVTTQTVTAARLLERRLPDHALHQFVPVDTPAAVDRFLDHWRPDLSVWTESELWPNLILAVGRRRLPALLINARMSERSFRRWRALGTAARRLLSAFSVVMPGAVADGDRFRVLGAPRVGPAGNLKYAADPPPNDTALEQALRAAIGNRPVWLAASTHPGEDEAVLAAHRHLLQTHPTLLAVIVPRHPERGPDILALCRDAGLTATSRSGGGLSEESVSVHVADTIGEMGTLMRLATVAFVGGSLIPHGGHNPIEPAQLAVAILHGPHMENFADIVADLTAAGGAEQIEDARDLADRVSVLLDDADRRARMTQAAAAVVTRQRSVLDAILAEIDSVLPPAPEPDR